jgi:hypothetical protein
MTPDPKGSEVSECPYCGRNSCCLKSVDVAKQRDHAAKDNHRQFMLWKDRANKFEVEISRLRAEVERFKAVDERQFKTIADLRAEKLRYGMALEKIMDISTRIDSEPPEESFYDIAKAALAPPEEKS